MTKDLKNRVTILVNSCDAYSDLWYPFFTLFKKYWDTEGADIILNTETKDFNFDDLGIRCIHPLKSDCPYGERMINVLHQIKTEYVITLLDDFFIRERVDNTKISDIIKWMDDDKSIVYFNCDVTPLYDFSDDEKYSGYRRIPVGNKYTLNMQAAVWRTKKLLNYWSPGASPWEWEEYCNLNASISKKDKFYCASVQNSGFCNYGFNIKGMGVHRKRWVIEDVGPLFEKENIHIDYNDRGVYTYSEWNSDSERSCATWRESSIKRNLKSDVICRCLPRFRIRFALFVLRNNCLRDFSCNVEDLFVRHILLKIRKRRFKKRSFLLKLHKLNNCLGFKRKK